MELHHELPILLRLLRLVGQQLERRPGSGQVQAQAQGQEQEQVQVQAQGQEQERWTWELGLEKEQQPYGPTRHHRHMLPH